MPQIPHDTSLESSLALLRDGYDFISRHCQRHQSDIFQTRLLLQNTICMTGADAAELFYDNERFVREDALPLLLQRTLVGRGGVQGLDGEAHRVRKRMFMSLMTQEGIEDIARLSEAQWKTYIDRWAGRESTTLFHEVQELLCRTVCAWSGVPLPEEEVRQRTQDMADMIDGAGGVGPRHLQAKRARDRSESWGCELIDRVRSGQLEVDEGRALNVFSWHRNEKGDLLETRVASVELLNVLRPTVAVARFIAFAALMLHQHPQWRQKLQDDNRLLEPFVQEVRRIYAFFPFMTARVRRNFVWRGYSFPKGTRVLLDLYGTCRDSRSWKDPLVFRPERFQNWDGSPFDFIPQGGGDHYLNHRCPGEWITIALMKVAVDKLTGAMEYDMPAQDLHVDLSRMPMIPESRIVIENVRPR
ncbi:fatty-acid peroxygenase [Halomonas shantousis]